MDYDPQDHTLTGRRVLSAWLVCLGIIGLLGGLTALPHDLATRAAAHSVAAAPSADSPAMNGVKIPRFALCRSDPPRSVTVAQRPQGPMSLPIDRCG